MTRSRPRLLIVDAAGGPHPQVYMPMLPHEFNIRVVLLPPADPVAARSRLRAVGEKCEVQVVHDRTQLELVLSDIAHDWKADGILAFSERVVHTANTVAHALGLPSNADTTQQALRDKYSQRATLHRHGVAVPAMCRVESAADLENAVRQVGLPAVLKPAVGMGSLSVFEVATCDQLEQLFEIAYALYTKDPRVQGTPPSFLLERKLTGQRQHADPRMGDYVSIESLVGNGHILHLTVSDKPPLVYPFRETGNTMPSTLLPWLKDDLIALADRSIRAIGMTVGAVHTEIKLTPDGPRVLEVNGRIGGGVTEMLYHAAGYNVVAELAHLAVGGTPRLGPTFTGFAAFLEPQPPPFRIRLTRVPSAEQLLSLPGVKSAEIIFPVGAEPDWRTGTGSNLARLIAACPDREELMQLFEKVSGDTLFEFQRLEDGDALASEGHS